MDSLNTLILEFDKASLKTVIEIIEAYGWLGIQQVGFSANQAIYLTIQHAPNPAIRKKYFPMLKESAEKGESNLSDMATMEDRILVSDGQAQKYGTQSHIEGRMQLYPIENVDRLKKLRKSVGLPKLN